jgi:protein arginine kinase
MLHLPALVLKNELEPITRGLAKIGHTVRGLWGEGMETAGHLFQISNQITLGQTEKTIIDHLEQIVREIMEHERNARAMLKKMKVPLLKDFVNRAQALVKHAQLFTTRDVLNQLSGLRLGAAMGILRNVDVATLDHLMLLTQPAHLQWAMGRAIDVPERDVVRARFIKEHLRRHAAKHIRNTHEDKAT